MKIIVDTNFILECVKNKVDIFDIEKYGKVIIPEQVLDELESLEIEQSELALRILEKQKFETISLDKKYVDLGIEKFLENKQGWAVATMDKDLKKKLAGKARIITLVNRKKIMLL